MTWVRPAPEMLRSSSVVLLLSALSGLVLVSVQMGGRAGGHEARLRLKSHFHYSSFFPFSLSCCMAPLSCLLQYMTFLHVSHIAWFSGMPFCQFVGYLTMELVEYTIVR